MSSFLTAGTVLLVVLVILGVFLVSPFLIMVLLGGLAHSLGYPHLAVGFGSSVQLTLLLCIVGMFFKPTSTKSS